jgi:signal transduction histidine kinase
MQLEESVQRAEKMEAIGRMAGGIAHDFNNLLNVISGFNELLAADVASSGRAAVAVSEIRRAVDRAGSLIQQLLVVSRRQMLEPVVMDVHAVVVDAENMMKRAVGDGVELVLELLAEHARIHADPAKIEHVLLNLAINARDAMPEGGVLTITTRGVTVDDGHPLRASLPKPGPYLLLSVSDTGLGMDQATLERIFEPFFTTKPRGKGTGLGLATVYGIIAQSDGHIDVQTELGRGSTFHIFLPSADPG